MHGVCTGYAWGMHGVCTGYARVCVGAWRHAWDMHGVCMGYARGMHGVCTGYARVCSPIGSLLAPTSSSSPFDVILGRAREGAMPTKKQQLGGAGTGIALALCRSASVQLSSMAALSYAALEFSSRRWQLSSHRRSPPSSRRWHSSLWYSRLSRHSGSPWPCQGTE